MDDPDWYRVWRRNAFNQLVEKNRRLQSDFKLGRWPRWDYDLDAGTLTFSEAGIPRVVAEIQIAGTTSDQVGNWLWSWGNGHWPVDLLPDAELARAFGREHGIAELTEEFVKGRDLNALGWKLTAVVVRLTDALGAYRPSPKDGVTLYLTCKSIAWTS